jgi:hypothetical protein
MKYEIVYDGKTSNDMSEAEKRLLELIAGETPVNDSERQMVKEIEDALKEGKSIDIPGM